MRIKQMIIYRKLSKMKNKILPTSLQGNYGDSLGECSNTSYGLVGAGTVKNDRCFIARVYRVMVSGRKLEEHERNCRGRVLF